MSKTISLSMIVKNESHVIKRLLTSVSPIIDYWVIVDTGSTDGTQQIVKDFFAEKGIPGELIEMEWVDFSTCRNRALQAAEAKADYGMWIDADEELIVHPTFTKEEIFKTDPDSVSLKTIYGRVEYTRKNIWKSGKNFAWSGPIHELLGSPEEKAGVATDKLSVIVRPEGSSWQNIQQKYAEHAKILEAYTEKDPDPRWVFYTAQSYRDSGQHEKSIEWYKKRAAIVDRGFLEEIYVSKFMVAKLTEASGKDVNTCAQLYQEAHSVDPVRAEALAALVQMYQRHQQWEMAYVFSRYGLQYNRRNPYPYRILFLEKHLYDFQLLELHALSCYYTRRAEEGAWAYWQMRAQLPQDVLSPEAMKKMVENEQWFPKDLASKFVANIGANPNVKPTDNPQTPRPGFRIPPKNTANKKKKKKR